MVDLKQLARLVSLAHSQHGGCMVELETGLIPKQPHIVVGFQVETLMGRGVSGKAVRRFLWDTRRVRLGGRRCLVSWYNEAGDQSILSLASATSHRSVADRLIHLTPGLSLIEVPVRG